jgi:hypothetical protein
MRPLRMVVALRLLGGTAAAGLRQALLVTHAGYRLASLANDQTLTSANQPFVCFTGTGPPCPL